MTVAADLTLALRPVVSILDSLKIDYYVTGSVASSVFGAVRATNDIDLVADLKLGVEEYFCNALNDRFYIDSTSIREAIEHKRSFNIVHLESAFKLDIFIARSSELDGLMLKRAKQVDIGTIREPFLVKFASPEDLILSKLRWYKEGGKVSEQQLRDIQGILKVQPRIDTKYLQNKAKLMGIEEILKQIQAALPRNPTPSSGH